MNTGRSTEEQSALPNPTTVGIGTGLGVGVPLLISLGSVTYLIVREKQKNRQLSQFIMQKEMDECQKLDQDKPGPGISEAEVRMLPAHGIEGIQEMSKYPELLSEHQGNRPW